MTRRRRSARGAVPVGVTLLLLALAAVPGGACSSSPSPAGDAGTPPASTSPPRPDAAADGSAVTAGLQVLSVTLPALPSDLVPLKIKVASTRGRPVRLEIGVSLDAGGSFRAARVRGPLSDLPVSAGGTEHLVTWRSLEDVGFHEPRAVRLRVVAVDAQGPSPALELDTPVIDNLRVAARRVQAYVINYGAWSPAAIDLGKRHDLVILHPTAGNLRRDLIAELQRGVDADDPADDVLVLCYISIGEDERSYGQTDEAIRADPRFRGDGSGPRVDPRGPDAPARVSLAGIDPLGAPAPGGTGWASYYLDDNSVIRDPARVGDGIPDRNARWGGFFINAGDPRWFDFMDATVLDSPDRIAGLRELLTTAHGRGLGCDGVFFDTVDTASPNSNTGPESSNLVKFEWTAPGMSRFIARVRERYPNRLLLQNRGLFFLDSRRPHYQFTTRGSIDYLFFESYRLGSRPTPETYHLDNRWNVTPKLMAEANRPDGFTVLSLGYAEGTGLPGALDTLSGKSMVGFESLLEDIHLAQQVAGFRHYLSNANISLVNTFVRDHSNFDDRQPPQWTSTYNGRPYDPMIGAQEPAARVGIQQVAPAPGGLTVRWDVALDLHRVGYALYYQDAPFDFTADPKLDRATRRVLTPSLPAAYRQGPGPTVYPYEETIGSLVPGKTYHFVIRAFDTSPAANEEANTVSLSGVAGPL